MKHFYFFRLAVFVSVIATFTSCQKEPGPTNPAVPGSVNKIAPDGFNYATSKTIAIDIRLLTNNNQPVSGVPVSFFNPRETSVNASLFKAISDKNGKVTGSLTIPGYLDTVLVKTNYIGLPLDVKVKLVNNALTATIGGTNGVSGNVVASVEESSGVVKLSSVLSTFATSFAYPSPYTSANAFETSGGYTQDDGRPAYVVGKDVISASLLENINAALPEGQALGATHPDYLSSAAVNTLKMVKSSEVWVTFVHEGAGYKNSLAYYIYDTKNPPTNVNSITDATFVFPNASADPGTALMGGDKVKIGTIPAGKSVGFVLLQDAWREGEGPKVKGKNLWGVATGNQKFYSNSVLNPETNGTNKHSVMVYDEQHELFLMGFEDLNRQLASANGGLASDNDFNDLVIYITSNPVDGISKDGVPSIDGAIDSDDDGVMDNLDEYRNDPTKAYNNYYPARDSYATLVFEDNWPKTGDYDLNDLVLKYRYTFVSNAQNGVVELNATYDVAAAGAANKNGFGVEFPFAPSLVSEVTGQRVTGGSVQLAANGLEAGQSKAVIIPFDNHDNVLKNTDGTPQVNTILEKEKVTGDLVQVKIKFTSPISTNTLGTAPFNPFLIGNGIRGYEIHLPGYTPTNLADKSFFGTEADNSSPSSNRYYLTSDNWPWALHFTETFQYPVEFKRIDAAYLHFFDWARSSGSSYADWYKNTASGYRNNSNIYNK